MGTLNSRAAFSENRRLGVAEHKDPTPSARLVFMRGSCRKIQEPPSDDGREDRSPVHLNRAQYAMRKPWYALWRAIERAAFTGRSYTLLAPWGHRVFTPWFNLDEDVSYERAYQTAAHGGPMGVSTDRSYLLHHFCRAALLRPGDLAECGVFQGGTAQLLATTINEWSPDAKTFHLFDTFQGMPPTTQPDRDYHSPGDFSATTLDYVKGRLLAFDFVRFQTRGSGNRVKRQDDTIGNRRGQQ